MIYCNLSDQQARYAIGKNWVVLIEPLPLSEYPPHPEVFWLNGGFAQTYVKGSWSPKLLFPINAEVGLRETWFPHHVYEPEDKIIYWYKADTSEYFAVFDSTNWCSPSTMPSCAIRHRGVITAARVCPMSDITPEELDAFGLERTFDAAHMGMIHDEVDMRNWYSRFRRRKGFVTFDSDPWMNIARVELR